MYETLSDWKRTHTIDKLPKKFEGRICVMGWIHEKEIINGETVILRLRDSTGSRDFALDRKSTSVDIFEKIRNLTVESVVGIKGKVIESSQLKIKMGEFSFKVFNSAYEPYPVNRNNLDMGSIPLLQKRQFILRNSKMTSILKIRSEVIRAIRKFLHNGCFVEFPTPTMQWGTDPGVRTAHLLTMPDFRETPYVLASSAQLYKQAAVIPLDKVYTIAPALRSERTVAKLTGRHLSDFWELDVEMAFVTYEDVMEIAEKMIQNVILDVKSRCKKELKNLNRDIQIPKIPFKRITHKDAVRKALDMGVETKKDEEISWEAEERLSRLYDNPVWIIDYPILSRAWYYRRDLENPKIVKTMDLLYPDGYGEGITGGEREYDYKTLTTRIKDAGEDTKTYEWYVEMFKFGMPPSAGFGLGIERYVRYICGLEYIWETTMFPRVPGIISP